MYALLRTKNASASACIIKFGTPYDSFSNSKRLESLFISSFDMGACTQTRLHVAAGVDGHTAFGKLY